jgi:hypothetical protein
MVQGTSRHGFFLEATLRMQYSFSIQREKERAKLAVVSKQGKEATVTILARGDFTEEEPLPGGS